MRNEGGGEHTAVDPATLDRAARVLHDTSADITQAGRPVSDDTVPAAVALQGWACADVLAKLASTQKSTLDMHASNLAGLAASLTIAAADYRAADQAAARMRGLT